MVGEQSVVYSFMDYVFVGVTCVGIVSSLAVIVLLIVNIHHVKVETVNIEVNQNRTLSAPRGGKLLDVLTGNGFVIPSGCHGAGKCGQCRCLVTGGGSVKAWERKLLDGVELEKGMRLSCQVQVRKSMKVRLPEHLLKARKYRCRVTANRNLTPFVKELELRLDGEGAVDFRAGNYVMVDIPAHALLYQDIGVDESCRQVWLDFGMNRYRSRVPYPLSCAYSIVNPVCEKGVLHLNIRVLQPESRVAAHHLGDLAISFISQPSAYLFNLGAGDSVSISGPFGSFFLDEHNSDLVFIGGGTGLSPLYNHIQGLFHPVKTERRVSLWYGCRNSLETLYWEELQRLAAINDTFDFQVVFSDPLDGDSRLGYTGHMRETLYDHYLGAHPDPGSMIYYLSGPLGMIAGVYEMLCDLGVAEDHIKMDEQAASRSILRQLKIDTITGATSLVPDAVDDFAAFL